MTTAEPNPGAQHPSAPIDTLDTEVTYEIFNDDQLSLTKGLIGVVIALLGGSILTLAAWFVLRTLTLPAFGGSLLTRAIATAGTVVTLVVTTILLFLFATLRRGNRPRWLEVLTYIAGYFSPALLVIFSVGVPLSSSRLWLDGLSVDQEFRTEYLTRMTSEFGLHDMSYIDVAPFYPGGWFFLGGRFANILGLAGWEAFQPWALITLAAAGCVLVPVWQRLGGSLPVATGIALLSTAVALVTTAEEPYAAVIAMGLPAMSVMAWRGLGGAWSAMAGVIVFLGISATFYTLHTAIGAIIVIVLTIVACSALGTFRPVLRLVIMGVGSMLVAATVWAPYLIALLTGAPRSGATATHYLPESGTQIPLPMFAASAIGIVALLGVIWLLVRATDPDARALAIGLLVLYGWAVASMIATLAGSTLLGFRLTAPITLMLVAAGCFAIADIRLNGVERMWPQFLNPRTSRRLTTVLAAILLLAGIGYAQQIPTKLHGAIDLAHTDTDGFGERADAFAPNAGAYYAEIDRTLHDAGLVPSETVVLSDEKNFQALYPWYSFQALTSHYANPLGEFGLRNETLREWSSINDADELIAAMDSAPWHTPDAIVLRGDLSNKDDSYTLKIARDIYPNNPNVVFEPLTFAPSAFAAHWQRTQVGPFIVMVRQ